ncbi:MAG: DUF420 domain-containing protein [Myxococcota bacterium]|jgi:putative membrane protein|nr:DUF420 domain-containing protein [Myxococcota bacterium]
MLSWLPHFGALCNLVIMALIVWALVAIRAGDRELHPKLMKAAIALGGVFLVSYIVQVSTIGHARVESEGLYRQVFLAILLTHTIAAVAMLPLVLRAAYLGIRGRFEDHKKVVRLAYPVWLYVGVTGFVVYLMIYHL